MSYNLTQVTVNGSGMLEFTQGVNRELMFGFLGNLMLMVIGVVFFLAFYRSTEDVPKSAAATAFICFVLSLFLRAVSLIPDITIYVTLILTAVSLVFLWRD